MSVTERVQMTLAKVDVSSWASAGLDDQGGFAVVPDDGSVQVTWVTAITAPASSRVDRLNVSGWLLDAWRDLGMWAQAERDAEPREALARGDCVYVREALTW